MDIKNLVAEILSPAAHTVREYATQAQSALRQRLPTNHPRPLAGRFRADRRQARGEAAHPEGECHQAAETRYGRLILISHLKRVISI